MLGTAEGCTSADAHGNAFSSTQSWRLVGGSQLVDVCVSMRHKVASGHCFPFHYHMI